MSATVLDVVNEYRAKIVSLPLVFAFVMYQGDRNTILFTTFFESIDHMAEDALADIESYMVDAFEEYHLDFRTIHLMGRELAQFVPHGAIPLIAAPKSALHRAGAR